MRDVEDQVNGDSQLPLPPHPPHPPHPAVSRDVTTEAWAPLVFSADAPEQPPRPAAGAGRVAAGPIRRYESGGPRTPKPTMLAEDADSDHHQDSDDSSRRLVIACDHRGWHAKHRLLPRLRALGWEVRDLGCDDADTACDYPDFAAPASQLVADGEADVAVLLDASGIGMGIVANKVRGVRAATCHDEFTARIAREHNHCNVLCVGTDLVGDRALNRIVELFLDTKFVGGRHVRRVAKLADLERQQTMRSAETLRASV